MKAEHDASESGTPDTSNSNLKNLAFSALGCDESQSSLPYSCAVARWIPTHPGTPSSDRYRAGSRWTISGTQLMPLGTGTDTITRTGWFVNSPLLMFCNGLDAKSRAFGKGPVWAADWSCCSNPHHLSQNALARWVAILLDFPACFAPMR